MIRNWFATSIKMTRLVFTVTALFLTVNQSFAATSKIQEAYQLYQSHRFKEAAAAFDEHLAKNPRDGNAMYYDALCNQQSGNMSRAKVLYRQTVQANPSSQVAKYAESVLVKVDPNYHPVGATKAGDDDASKTASAAAAPSSEIRGPDHADVYYTPNGKRMMLTVGINGHNVEMMLDTGAPGICIGKRELESIGIHAPAGDPTGVTGGAANGNPIGTWDLKADVSVGPFTYPNTNIVVMDSENGNALLGQTFVKLFEYQIDQSAHRISFTKKGAKRTASGTKGYDLPFTFREAGNRIIVEGEINGRKSKFMMDTGNSGSGIAFHTKQQAAAYGAPVPDDAQVKTFSGVSGTGSAYVYTIPHLKVGPIDCLDLEVAAHSDGGMKTEEPLLGHEVFSGWQYTVDYDAKVIHLLRR